MPLRTLCATLLALLPFGHSALAGNSPSPEIDPDTWAAIERQIEAEVDRDLIAGEDHFLRGGIGSEHGLVRTGVVSGDYSDLAPQDNSFGPRFGHSVAIEGDWLAVGAPGTIWTSNSFGTADHGAVFIFRRTSDGWTLTQRILRVATSAGGRCGHSVAMSLPYLVAGCPTNQNNSGTQTIGWTFVFRQDEGGHFLNSSNHPGSIDGRCGSAVSISQDYLAIGCPTAADGTTTGGRVQVRRRNPDTGTFNSEVTWLTPPNALANASFGEAVAVNQSFATPVRLAVGAPLRSPSPLLGSGGVHVFQRSTPGGTPTWTQSQFITAPTQTSLSFFGQAVALGRNQLVVGAPGDFCGVSGPGRCGRAYRYAHMSGTWQHQETGYPINTPGGAPNGAEPGMRFGEAVAMGFDNLTAIGAPRTNGSNSLFGSPEDDVGLVELRRTGSGQLSVFTYSGVVRPPPLAATVLAEGRFGTSVNFSSASRAMAVGYPGVGSSLPIGSGGSRRGQVWIYESDELFANGFETLPRAALEDQP